MDDESKEGPAPAQRLLRSPDSRIIAGVCGGLGRHTRIDPVVFRVGFALLALAGGSGILLYILAALLLPGDEVKPSPIEQLVKRRFDAEAVLAILMALLGLGLLLSLPGADLDGPLVSITLFGLVLLVAHGRGVDLLRLARTLPERVQGRPAEPQENATTARVGSATLGSGADSAGPDLSRAQMGRPETGRPETGRPETGRPETGRPQTWRPEMIDLATLGSRPRTPASAVTGTYDLAAEAAPAERADGPVPRQVAKTRPPSVLTPVTLLTALLIAAVMAPIASAQSGSDRLTVMLGSGLAVVAVGLVIGSWYGRARGLVTAGTLLSVALVTTSVAAAMPAGGRFGDVTWRPVDAGQSDQTYRLIAGQGALDLTALPLRPGQRIRIEAELGLGEMRVKLPRSARVELRARAVLGDVTVDGRITSGPRVRMNEVLLPEGQPTGIPPTIELFIRGRLGDVEVTRA